jgi:integrase
VPNHYKPVRGVFERPPGSGTWWINYYVEGVQHREKVGSYRAAVDAYYARKVAIREGRFSPPRPENGVTFGELIDLSFADRKTRIAARYYIENQRDIRRWREWFGKWPAAKVTAAVIAEKLRGMREDGLTGATANRHKALVSAVFAWGVQQGKVALNPAHAVAAYRENDGRVRYLDEGEEAAIRKILRRDYPEREAELDVALHTGMRRNELYRMTWDQVNLERGILTVMGKAHANSRSSSRRFIPINSVCRVALEQLYARSNGSAYVCPGSHLTGTETDRDNRKWFQNSVAAAKVENFKYHDLRHTFASRLVMAGVPIEAVKELMGHRTIQMTMRYAHLAPDFQAAAIETLATKYGQAKVVPLRMVASGGRTGTRTGTSLKTRNAKSGVSR